MAELAAFFDSSVRTATITQFGLQEWFTNLATLPAEAHIPVSDDSVTTLKSLQLTSGSPILNLEQLHRTEASGKQTMPLSQQDRFPMSVDTETGS